MQKTIEEELIEAFAAFERGELSIQVYCSYERALKRKAKSLNHKRYGFAMKLKKVKIR